MPFFPFNPRRMRVALAVGAGACSGVAAWALANAASATERFGLARAGIALGLMLALLYLFHSLRPRPGWGVLVEPLTLSVSRPLKGEVVVLWSHVRRVERAGRRGGLLVISLAEGRLALSRQLFSRHDFEQLQKALEEHAPRPPYDA